ncbi:MAG: replication-associated recombination protein A, partial [Pseudomonadota bacterium]
PPKHILNAPTDLMKDQGYGAGYEYDHDAKGRFSGQNYFPEGMARPVFYAPAGEGREKQIAERLKVWADWRKQRGAL